jgi:hypothetical protein
MRVTAEMSRHPLATDALDEILGLIDVVHAIHDSRSS